LASFHAKAVSSTICPTGCGPWRKFYPHIRFLCTPTCSCPKNIPHIAAKQQNDPNLLAEKFTYIEPLIGPLDKEKYLDFFTEEYNVLGGVPDLDYAFQVRAAR